MTALDDFYSDFYLIDTGILVGIFDEKDQYNAYAASVLTDLVAYTSNKIHISNLTLHESYTRLRYNTQFQNAFTVFENLPSLFNFKLINWSEDIESKAVKLLKQYSWLDLSFHDAFCAALALNQNIPNIVSFDSHFRQIGFNVIP